MIDSFATYFQEVRVQLAGVDYDSLIRIRYLLSESWMRSRTIFLAGNGGSSSSCSHIVNDFQKGLYQDGKTFRAMCLTDNTSLLTAYANDIEYSQTFTEQLKIWLRPNDMVILLSGSGNSKNIVNAAKYSQGIGAIVVGFVGFDGGELKPLCQEVIHVRSDCQQVVEDVHMACLHALFLEVKKNIQNEYKK